MRRATRRAAETEKSFSLCSVLLDSVFVSIKNASPMAHKAFTDNVILANRHGEADHAVCYLECDLLWGYELNSAGTTGR